MQAGLHTEYRLSKGLLFAALVVAAILIAAYALIPPQFDESYVRSLLARHDPELARANLTALATETDGRPTVSKIDSAMFEDPVLFRGSKEIEIVSSENGSIISGSILELASTSIAVAKGTLRSWNCPGGTVYNMSVEETPQYLYIGITNTYVPLLALQGVIQAQGGLSSNVEPDWNESMNPELLGTLGNVTPLMLMSETYYYNPAERGAFDAKRAEVAETVAGCEEVGA